MKPKKQIESQALPDFIKDWGLSLFILEEYGIH